MLTVKRRAGWIILAVVLLSEVWALPTWAGPPFTTDDPETPARHGWEINIPFTLERTRDESAVQAPLFDVNYGYKSNVQLKLEFPHLFVHHAGRTWTRGLGDTHIGVKWRFREEGRRRPQFAVYPQAVLPTGNRRRGLGDGKPSYLFPLVAQKGCGKWTAYGNVGYVAQTKDDSRNYWYHGVTFVHEVSERLSLGTEVFGSSATEAGGRSGLSFSVGGAWKICKGGVLLFSAGRSVRGSTSTMVYVGLQILTKDSE